jgi:hypothetical protein
MNKLVSYHFVGVFLAFLIAGIYKFYKRVLISFFVKGKSALRTIK